MNVTSVWLEFAPELNSLDTNKALRDGLSAVVQIGTTLWLANDETCSLERLAPVRGEPGEPPTFGLHHGFPLDDLLRLPSPERVEADIEGLAYEDGYLWLVGSHSRKRKNPVLRKGNDVARKQLAHVRSGGNRFLLARIPVDEDGGIPRLVREARRSGLPLTAAQLRGNDAANDLIEALRDDSHLGVFIPIPGKDNGFDIEGLAVFGKRLFLGLRGPVLRGWAVILEVELEETSETGLLQLKAIGPDNRLYRKHFLQLEGLGVRDLCRHGADLLILAGPTMYLDGPVAVYRWRNGAIGAEESVVAAAGLERLFDVPSGRGVDHAEGMALLPPDPGQAGISLLVVYDSASEVRKHKDSAILADIFTL